MKYYFILLGSLAVISSLSAESNLSERKLVFQLDNDLFAGTDRDYTSGVRLAFLQELDPDRSAHDALQSGLYRISDLVSAGLFGETRLKKKPLRFSWGVGLTQLMYTPEDPDLPASPLGERPYAGWLGAEFTLNASDDDSVAGITLSIGTTGPNSLTEEAQHWVHENISDSPVFQGWDSQVPGELTLNLHFDHKEKIGVLEQTSEWPIEFDGYFEGGFALGNFRTNAYLGTLVRSGINLPNTYATPRVELGTYGHALFAPDEASKAFSFYGFVGVRGTAVAHDITLDGPLFRDYGLAVDSEEFVGAFIFGFVSHIHGMVLSVSQTSRSDEFKSQSDAQTYGSVMLQASFAW
jgi:hypothetical protein